MFRQELIIQSNYFNGFNIVVRWTLNEDACQTGRCVCCLPFNVCLTHEVPGEEIHARICGMNMRKGRNYDVPMTSARLKTPERCNLLSLNY